jgi:hypothetical protein
MIKFQEPTINTTYPQKNYGIVKCNKIQPTKLTRIKNRWDECTSPKIVYFICSLFNYALSVTQHNVEWKDDRWMVNWKGCGRKRSWPKLRYYPGICLEGPRKTTKNINQNSRSPGWNLNSEPPEHDVRALTTRPQHSVQNRIKTMR